MFRLLSIVIECFSSIVFIVPAMLIFQYCICKQHNSRKLVMVFIFAFYSVAVFSATGIPTAYTLKVYYSFNVIPLADIFNNPAGYIKNTIPNIILFMPMGFLLPAVWREYQAVKKTVLAGFLLSLVIEVSQIFTFRLTDIDDLITNTLGTFLGYYAAKLFSFKLPLEISINNKNSSVQHEPVVILIIVFLIGFFLKPVVSDAIWDILLSSPLWENIK